MSSTLLGVSAGAAVLMLGATLAAWRHLGPAAVVYRAALAAAGQKDLDGQLPEVRGGLAFNTAVLGAAILGFAVLAVLVWRPLRWTRTAVWWSAGVLGSAVMIALAGDAGSSGTGPGTDEVERLAHELIPGWYAAVLSLLGLVLLVAAVVAAVALARSSVGEFYRPPTVRPADDRWAAALKARTDGTGDDGQR